jgi:LCP family protein required for cell wall assembly
MDNKTTQYDKRLSEYRDRLLQRNKEMTTDDDELIDSIINQNEPENSKADGKADGTSEEKMADSVSADASSAKETPVSESYKEYADKLESVLKEVGVATAEKSESKQPTERIKEDRVAEERKRLAYKKLGYEEQTQDDTMESEADMDESEEDGHTVADVFANLRESVRDAVGEAEKKVRSRKPVRSEVGNDGQKRSFRLNTLGKWAVTGIVLFVVFLILTIGYVSANKSYKYNQMDIRPIKNSDLVVNEGVKEQTKGYTTIALYGVDSRDSNLDTGTNSDAIILLSINKDTKEVKMVSVYRDTLLQIQSDSQTTHKVNYAYQLGGALMSINTLNANLDLAISDYITVDFNAMADIINALGGVEVTVTEDEVNNLNKNLAEQIGISGKYSEGVHEAGTKVLNGQQAVAYSRIRSTGKGDITRTMRQRTVLLGLVNKMINADSKMISNLIDVSFSCISTSLTKDEVTSLAKDIADYKITGNIGFPFSYTPMSLDGKGSVIVAADLNANVTALHEYLYGTSGYTPSTTASSISTEVSSETGVAATEAIDIDKVSGETAVTTQESSEASSESATNGSETGSTTEVQTITTPPAGMIENE